jgi:hypothetical protein
MAKAKQSMDLGSLLEQAFGTEKERVSFTISADLYDAFAEYATAKEVSMANLFRAALRDFAEVAFPNSVADAKFAAVVADAQSIDELPKLPKGNSEWMN